MVSSPRLVLIAALILASPAPARAAAHEHEEEDDVDTRIDAREFAAHLDEPEIVGHQAPLWIALQGSVRDHDDGRRDFGAMVLLGLPLGRIAQSSPKEPPALD